jgi:rhodanese-related sulfurtransferase
MGMTNESVSALKKALAGDNPPVLVDVRTRMEYAGGHVPGAIHGQIPDGPVWLICASGARSAAAAQRLAAQGRTVVNVTGGTGAWAAKGWPLDKAKGGGMAGLIVPLVLALTLGLAPFFPEPHLLGKVRWVMGGAHGMTLMDWGDLVMHGAPWVWLAWKVVKARLG